DLHGIHALGCQRRVRLVTPHAAAPALLALVSDDELHAGRFTDDASGGRDTLRDNVRDQAAYADAADFLVIRQREMERSGESATQEFGHEREADRRKALQSRR